MVVVSRNWKLAIGMVATGFLGLVLLTASGSTMLVDRLSTATNPTEDASYNVRVGYITTYIPEIAKRPFGYGINSSGQSGLKASGGSRVRNGVVGVPTDNYYFKVALEMGWVGLALFLWLNIAAIVSAWRVYNRTTDPYYKALALGVVSVLSAIAVGAFSNDINSQKPISEFFWIMLGLAMLIGQHRPARAAAPPMLYLPAPQQPPRRAS
jgi:cell division protein FtsW (lipid II flippase)